MKKKKEFTYSVTYTTDRGRIAELSSQSLSGIKKLVKEARILRADIVVSWKSGKNSIVSMIHGLYKPRY